METIRDPYRDAELPEPDEVDPTVEQAEALRAIHGAIGQGAFKSLLLYGVTGSGKTHVYVKSIEKTLEAGRSAIVLVPELALTPQAVRQFRAHFGDLVTVLHSGLSPGERYDSWRRTRAGDYRIVVGAGPPCSRRCPISALSSSTRNTNRPTSSSTTLRSTMQGTWRSSGRAR